MEFLALAELAVLLGGIALLLSTYITRKRGTPFYPTPLRAIRDGLAAVQLRRGELFYDLGAGTGRALLVAEREFGARAAGYELSTLFYVIGKINLWLHRSRAELRFGNFLDADLRDADVVFCFLVARALPDVEEKLRAELKPGARITAYAFPLPSIRPTRVINIDERWKMFVYDGTLMSAHPTFPAGEPASIMG